MNTELPPVAPEVVAAAVEHLTSRLRKKLDAAIETYTALPVTADGTVRRVRCGEDAEVTLTPGPSGAVTHADQAQCSCLLAPRCLHRAAVLGAAPVADADVVAEAADQPSGRGTEQAGPVGGEQAERVGGEQESGTPDTDATAAAPPGPAGPSAAQVAAAAGLWAAAAAVLAAGVPGAGAVPQAEVLRAAHTARLAGLHRAEAAALRVVRALRAARARHDGHRLADLVAGLRELLLTSGLLAASDPDPALVGTARRGYRPGGGLKVHGVCREPVISATGYGGVVTHVLAEDGRWFSVSDVKPGGPARARGAATATVALGAGSLDHAQLSRSGLLISGATLSPDGRLGAGKGVRATPVTGLSWTSGQLAPLFARPLAQAAAAGLAPGDAPERSEAQAAELIGCDVVVVGAAGDHLLARELVPDGADREGLLIRLLPANGHPELAHAANFRKLAARPGLRLRLVGRLDPDRAATLRPLAVGPVPDGTATLRLPPEWAGHADLGYDRLEGAHFPTAAELPPVEGPSALPPDPVSEAPLWRLRRLVEVAVSGGRRAAAEPARDGARASGAVALRRSGFQTAADLAEALAAEADRRGRDVFGRTQQADPDAYARVWLSAAVYLSGTERALVEATWQP
ncbi:SWIM zinc finger family protein [Streptomyces sp. NRRL B-24085]|uniref:SWIM zinc finger family protein n=1 Tax=Streptomyces sp. NRRL B-24085 TaxID=1709476 RepID=UPI0006B374BC|nr:SWIM zinc finger family protein [Streptomyces sp. NRRL B-24085]